MFVARADNASGIVWRFVSPDGRTDKEYSSVSGSVFRAGSGLAVTPALTPTDYSGVYQETNSGRGDLRISGSPDHYDISVDWSFNPGENTTWTFSGTFDNNGTLNFSDCVKVTTAYYENGEVQEATTEYSWAIGGLSTDGNGGFVWSIPQDSSVSGSIFR
ncbi:MAG: hypothetical protein IJV40_08765 [Oscillospiraceae bacterium]|nr:hypothetical protein [Oscillospiraceae bacterium]